MKWIILFGLVALAHTQTYNDTIKTASSFCRMNVCPKGTSVACSFTKSVKMLCTDGEILPLDKDALTKQHNDYRQKIASGKLLPLYLTATHMAEVTYNEELAQMALYNAKGCANAHDSCSATTNFPMPGQNLGIIDWYDGINVNKTVSQLVDTWFNENKSGNMLQIKDLVNFVSIGRFTQMVQEKNTAVGCAASSFTVQGTKSLYLVCNYGYGNLSPIYLAGSSASKCITKSSTYKNLCSVY